MIGTSSVLLHSHRFLLRFTSEPDKVFSIRGKRVHSWFLFMRHVFNKVFIGSNGYTWLIWTKIVLFSWHLTPKEDFHKSHAIVTPKHLVPEKMSSSTPGKFHRLEKYPFNVISAKMTSWCNDIWWLHECPTNQIWWVLFAAYIQQFSEHGHVSRMQQSLKLSFFNQWDSGSTHLYFIIFLG